MTADGLSVPTPQLPLAGRGPERARLRKLLATTAAGRSEVLVLRGGAGLGKTALMEDLATNAIGHRVVRVRGSIAETGMAYAALHLLCSALPAEVARLETHQRDALETAVGLRAGPPPERFLLCVAVMSLLTLAAEEQPLLCAVDDVQWLDDPSTDVLSFVARRVGPVPVALLFADRGERVTGLPELVLGGLTHLEAHQLLDAALPAALDHAVLERMIAEARGNPRVLLESVRSASPVALAGGYDADTSYEGEPALFDGLAPESRLLLILAAAEPMGDPVRLWRAAARLGLEASAAQQLEAENLVSFGAWVVFRHPRLRWTIYGTASAEERRRAHEALALATDPLTEPDRRVWHLAHSRRGPDDALGDQLAGSADKARERGGLAAAAAFLERAAICTADAGLRVERAVMAADAYHSAGAVDAAVRLLATAELGSPDAVGRARIQRVRARMAFDASRGSAAVAQLMDAARALETCRPRLAGPAYVEALGAAVFTGHVDIVHEALARLSEHQPGGNDRLIEGVAELCTTGYASAVEPLKLALKMLDRDTEDDTRPRLLSCLVAADLWDDAAWNELTGEQLNLTRLTGARTLLPYVLTHRALVEIQSGEFDVAASLVAEATSTAGAVGTPSFPHAAWLLAAWRGHEAPAPPTPEDSGRGAAAGVARYAAAVLANGACAYGKAVEATHEVLERDAFELQGWSLTELVEGAVRSGDLATAAEALDRLSERACLAGTDWALGVEAQSRALLRAGRTAEDLYQEAIERLGRSGIRTQLARAQLLYGEWLRRQGRRVDARGPLRTAHDSFVTMGADAFAERTHRELLATGERARRREPAAAAELTAQEIQIASLARDGRSNPEIGITLSISPRTVEYHLHKVFTKLSITSRTELHLVLSDGLR
ncbi:helix-turn-helix transcriptional regulator [Kribbella speibonae]|uniref:Helix-turn-helix transcriptional regulator n=1 Tax=Kribbella speibonae TaxID=1572660 RepID=A0ABY2AC51_9ACTN|nr:LuxR family transcriptional regulator [Kribbella speibonae]TCC26840.1 helix-turn-helix transcriptional regulator [Kribbella speibonae]